MSSIVDVEDLTILHWWPAWWTLLLLVMLLDDVLDVVVLLHGPQGHEDDENEAEACFLSESMGDCRSVSPDHPLSALTDGHDLSKEEESDH